MTTYPNEMHTFLLKNTNLIETGSLTDAVETTIFTAINERIAKKLERLLWEASYDILNDDEDSSGETWFCPITWPQRKDGSRLAYYRIAESGKGNDRWLSSLIGLNKTQTCLELYVDGRLGGPKVKVKERILEFHTKTPALHELGFICTDDGELRLPFSFEAAKLAEEYPDLRKQMLAFEGVFDKLIKGHELIDKLIKGMTPETTPKPESKAQAGESKKDESKK